MVDPAASPAVADVPALGRTWVLLIDDQSASRPGLSGTKAANLAVAGANRLPVVPAAVLTVAGAAAFAEGDEAVRAEVSTAWRKATDELARRCGGGPLVVRSSSPGEDTVNHSLAGQFTSVLGVRGWEAVTEATRRVVASAVDGGSASAVPMAVLAQPQIHAKVSGVLFGSDPVTSARGSILVAAVHGTPERLVSGTVEATHYHLATRTGAVRDVERPATDAVDLTRTQRRALARLARRAARVFGGPQDLEWGYDEAGKLWLFQARPITTHAPTAASSTVFSQAGVDETLPDPLAPLEADLWIPPLREALRSAVAFTGAVSARELRHSPVLVTVEGYAVADQILMGRHVRHVNLLDPRPGLRRLRAAWRVGRLRGALPELARQALANLDRSLLDLPELAELDDNELDRIVVRSGESLRAAHGMEALMGLLLAQRRVAPEATGAGVALQVLAQARRGEVGLVPASDDELVARHPVLLALSPPRIGAGHPLPATPDQTTALAGGSHRPGRAPVPLLREALRLRARWVQELQVNVVTEMGRRLQARGVLDDLANLRRLTVQELRHALGSGWLPAEASSRPLPDAVALPRQFRLSAKGEPIPVRPGDDGDGQAGGGGRGSGTAVQNPDDIEPGSVLVTRTLDPRLAVLLPKLAGLVSETGSPLSHLAILAREHQVPLVVDLPDARQRFLPGYVSRSTGIPASSR